MKVTASALRVRSGPGVKFRIVGRLELGADVNVIEEYEGWGWVEPGGGWVDRRFLSADAKPTPAEPLPPPSPKLERPRGLPGIMRVFGPPAGPMATAGLVTLPAPLQLGWEDKKITSFRCHKLVADPLERAFQKVHDRGLWEHLHTFDGCFNDRPIKKGGRRSTHAWAISVDLNASTNRQGTRGDMHPGIVQAFEEEGFVWGGRFSGDSIDPMHMQYAEGY